MWLSSSVGQLQSVKMVSFLINVFKFNLIDFYIYNCYKKATTCIDMNEWICSILSNEIMFWVLIVVCNVRNVLRWKSFNNDAT